jgi:hypothetical protein
MKKTSFAIALYTGWLAAGGCNYSERDLDPTLEGFFVEDTTEQPKPNRIADAQAASGARADAVLYNRHFDGPRLNSLGEQKLSLMLADDDAPDPLVVYVDTDEKAAAAAGRRAAVATFLKDRGLRDDQVQVVFGDNPAARSSAAQHLSRQSRTESGDSTGGAGIVDSGRGGGGGGGHEPGGGFNTDMRSGQSTK